MQIHTYLTLPGTAWAAAQFYADVFDAPPPEPMRMGDMPDLGEMGLSDAEKALVAHVRVRIGERELMMSDRFERFAGPHGGFSGFDVMIECTTPEEAQRYFERLAVGGTIRNPLEESSWALAFGALTDKFGVHWMVNCDRPT